ncbi:MAG: hypothetical protein Q8Q91_02985 [Candidatus Daviesbacteria bacterium]|nr:hypothetical protein [Candidatus Daviesbacteria bacterium]
MTIIKKFDPEEYSNKFPKKYVVFAVVGILVLSIAQIWVNNTAVSYGARLESIGKLKSTLEMENTFLENEMASELSLTNIATKSSKLGFSKIESIQYIR